MSNRSRQLISSLHRAAVVPLCLMLLNPGLTSAQLPQPPPTAAPNRTKLDPDQRILHLLSRFTFGPTSKDIVSVRKLGIDPWFEQQLHPDNLPDPQLTARLAEFPALQLPVDQLIERFPSGAMVRQTANGKLLVPNDRYLSAIYARHIDIYEEKQAKKAETANKPDQAKTPPESQKSAMATTGDMAGAPPVARENELGSNTMTVAPPVASQPSPALPNSVLPNSALPSPAKPADPNRPSYVDLLVKSTLALPPAERVNRVLAMQPAEYEQFHSSLKAPQKAQLIQDMTPAQRELLADFENPSRAVVEELQAQRLLRDIYSSHQLQEVMTTFWLNHFNVYLHKNEETPYYLVSYERDVIRPRVLGNFEDLLVATAESPAMLIYLDNSSSTGPDSVVAEKRKQREAFDKIAKPNQAPPPGLNENYARELMELHTLGVNGGYTQKDVTEVAKVFTGWTVDKPAQGGAFKFDETRHEPGKKLVRGKTIKENGQKEGLQLLHALATSPATAHFISQELAIAFVSDTPPPALVNRMAKTFLGQHGDIGAVLKAMLHSPEFWSPADYQTKIKTPLEYVVSAARASGAEIANPQPLVNALNQMGMPLYACVPPTGYSDKADEWVSTGALVTRMNFALTLASNHYAGIKADWSQSNSQTVTPDSSEQILEARLVPTGVSEQTRTAVLNQSQTQAAPASPPSLSNQPPPGKPASAPAAAKPPSPAAQAAAIDRQNAQLAGLLLGSPEFQRR